MNFTEDQLKAMIAQFEKDAVPQQLSSQINIKRPTKPIKPQLPVPPTPGILAEKSAYPDILESTHIDETQREILILQNQNQSLIGELEALKIENAQFKEQLEEIDWHRKKLKQEQIGRARIENKLKKLEDEYKKVVNVQKQSQDCIELLQKKIKNNKDSFDNNKIQRDNVLQEQYEAENSRYKLQIQTLQQQLEIVSGERNRIKDFYENKKQDAISNQGKLEKVTNENKKLKIEIYNLKKEVGDVKAQYINMEEEYKNYQRKSLNRSSSATDRLSTSQIDKQQKLETQFHLDVKQLKQANLQQKKQFEDRCFKYESQILELQFELQNYQK
ncbi:hypothetical protein SS50377_26607 [Spironucleus salmonicida]|uniref:Uncharacterized protein n=1 Tax=Spironucleus salmonicida TaxID=348837 RepID=V6LB46_9EUKA|nr:hypothetical protein SS50377_26607 [Spironucleus salmonicida]|eukprot:EST41458.1 Hypothetical protein SS50377_19177 [Spironucleus salmonicida]